MKTFVAYIPVARAKTWPLTLRRPLGLTWSPKWPPASGSVLPASFQVHPTLGFQMPLFCWSQSSCVPGCGTD